MSQQLSLANT